MARLERFVNEVVWSRRSDYRQLLLADYLYLNPRLAEYYDATPPENGRFAKAALPDGKRAGIFTHPYLLAANAYHDKPKPHLFVLVCFELRLQAVHQIIRKPLPELPAFRTYA